MNTPRTPEQQLRRETIVRMSLIGFVVALIAAYFITQIFVTPLEADNFTNGYSTSPAGHSAMIELLRENKRAVRHGLSELKLPEYEGSSTETLALVQPGLPYLEHYEENFRNLFRDARERDCSVLLVLPKRTYEQADEPGEGGEVVLYEDLLALYEVNAVLEASGFDKWFGIERLEGDARMLAWNDDAHRVSLRGPAQVFRTRGTLPGNFEVLASIGDAPVVVRHRAKTYSSTGGVLLVSDPDVFTNRYIHDPGAAGFVMRVFEETPRAGAIIVDEDLHGFSTDASLEYLAATPPGLWVTLSVLLLLGVFGWRQATVLRPQKYEPQDRRARKFSIEGLARMMERAGDHDKAYRRILWRARLVLGSGGAQVQGAGKQGTQAMKKGKTGRITRIQGATTEERLINAAARVAHQKRTGESASDDWQ